MISKNTQCIKLVLIFLLSALVHSDPAAASQRSRLFVETVPERARIKILNIRPKFQQGIRLKTGKYYIQASAEGFATKEIWVKLSPFESRKVRMRLKKINPSKAVTNPIFKFHTVRQYDTLWRISKKYNVSTDYLRGLNDLKSERLEIGQKILIPTKPILKNSIHKYKDKRAVELLKTGHKYLSLQEYRKAIDFYYRALQINPHYLKAYYSIGFAYLKLENNHNALKAFNMAIERDAYNAESYYNLGLVYFIIGEKNSALDHYKILKKLNNIYAEKLLGYIKILDYPNGN